MTPEELIGTVWDGKYHDRTVQVQCARFHAGRVRVQLINLETRRVSRRTLDGLCREFARRPARRQRRVSA